MTSRRDRAPRAVLGALAAGMALVPAGCGGAHRAVSTATTSQVTTAPSSQAARVGVGVVGPLTVAVPGTVVTRGSFATVGRLPIVVVSSRAATAGQVSAWAAANPSSRYVLVGVPTRQVRQPNLVGALLRTDQAALLGGVAAGLVALDEGGSKPRVAWVGPQTKRLAAAFTRGVHEVAPKVTVLLVSSGRLPAACKEAALTALARGAVAVMAGGGLCAAAVAAGAHEQNRPALALDDFELPSLAAALLVRGVLQGTFRGSEDLMFGAASGAVDVRQLDPRIPSDAMVRTRAAARELASGLQPTG